MEDAGHRNNLKLNSWRVFLKAATDGRWDFNRNQGRIFD